MEKQPTKSCCERGPDDKELSLDEAGYDATERAVLHVARFFWQSFATPNSHAWISAMTHAERYFGGSVAFKVLCTVQAMRVSRVSCFRFNNPSCKGCAAIVSEHERHFMNTFMAVRAGRRGPAETHAMMLCEGNDTRPFIEQMTALVDATCARPKVARFSSVASTQD
ncbi:MAG: hypothetical protein AAGF27_00105 [Pseudomonadota bacterium]